MDYLSQILRVGHLPFQVLLCILQNFIHTVLVANYWQGGGGGNGNEGKRGNHRQSGGTSGHEETLISHSPGVIFFKLLYMKLEFQLVCSLHSSSCGGWWPLATTRAQEVAFHDK